MSKAALSSKKVTRRQAKSRTSAKSAEENAFLKSLAANKQVQTGRGKLKPGVTHTLEKTPSGVVLRRKRFSAV
jgi:hypothetical protein